MNWVAITKRIVRKRLLDPIWEPPARVLNQLGDDLVGKRESEGEESADGDDIDLHDPWLIIDWLDASSNIRDKRKMDETAKAFSVLFARGVVQSAEELQGGVGILHSETLRRARIRLDTVAMLVLREYLTGLMEASELSSVNQVAFYMFVDSSPQWSQEMELLAVSFGHLCGWHDGASLAPPYLHRQVYA